MYSWGPGSGEEASAAPADGDPGSSQPLFSLEDRLELMAQAQAQQQRTIEQLVGQLQALAQVVTAAHQPQQPQQPVVAPAQQVQQAQPAATGGGTTVQNGPTFNLSGMKCFAGKEGEDLEAWLFSITTQMQGRNIAPQFWAQIAISLLEDTAQLWWRQQCRDQVGLVPAWADLVAGLKVQFVRVENDRDKILALFTLKQTGSIGEYVAETRRVILQLQSALGNDTIPEKVLVTRFIEGFKNDQVKVFMDQQKHATLEAALASAKAYERLGPGVGLAVRFTTPTDTAAPMEINALPRSPRNPPRSPSPARPTSATNRGWEQVGSNSRAGASVLASPCIFCTSRGYSGAGHGVLNCYHARRSGRNPRSGNGNA